MTRTTRSALAAVLVVAAVAAGVAAMREPTPAAVTAPELTTPLWSVRRAPGLVVDPLNRAREADAAAGLQSRLAAEAARFGNACFEVRRGSQVVAAGSADAALIPASTQKLLVAAASLAVLGPDFRFVTQAVADGGGTSTDRVWVVGAGDPVMRSADLVDAGVSTPLDALADAIVGSGVQRIGTLVADDSRYDRQRDVPTWKPSYREDLDVGPVGALVVDQGITTASGRPVPVADPELHFVATLAEALRARGVEVGGLDRGGAPPDARPVGTVESQPLRTILGFVLAVSDNGAAEMLTKEVGVRVRQDGSTAAGTAAVRETLGRLGVDLADATMVDGSGLDRGNRLACRDLVAVLALAERPDLAVLRELLPGDLRVDGDGTVRGKSGYLDDVTGLAGTVRPGGLTFAVLLNGGVPGPARNAVTEIRRFADLLGAYRPPAAVPDATVPGPGPVTGSAR